MTCSNDSKTQIINIADHFLSCYLTLASLAGPLCMCVSVGVSQCVYDTVVMFSQLLCVAIWDLDSSGSSRVVAICNDLSQCFGSCFLIASQS